MCPHNFIPNESYTPILKMLNTLNDSLYLLAGAFDLFPDAILVVDIAGTIRNANKQVESVFGYTVAELHHQNLNMLLPGRYTQHHHNFVAKFFDTTTIRKMGAGVSLFGRRKDGREIDIDIALSLIETTSGKYALAVVRDISDKMRLVDHISSIEKIKKELEQFSYVLTHDLKAPLQKVKALTHLIHLELPEKESDDIKTMISYINESVDGMESLIHGVLEYHKAKLTKDDTASMVDLNEVFEQAIKLLEIPESFTVKVRQRLPSIIINKTSALQIFLNLISNAISHNKNEKGLLEIGYTVEGDKAVFTFADNGSPIPAALRENLFEISSQIKNAAERKSNGFGLSIVREIVEGNKSQKLWYEDSDLGGTAFKFTWNI